MIWKILSWESVSFGDENNWRQKWIKADILKTQSELKVLSPSPALLRRRGKEGLAQTAPGLGKSQLQTRFTFLAKLSLAIHKEGAALKKRKRKRQPSTVEIKEKSSAASSTSNYSTIQSVLFLPITFNRWSKAGLEKECWAKWSAQAVLEDLCWCGSGSSSHCAIALWCQWAGYYYTVYSSEGHSPTAAHSEWTKAGPWERREKFVNL